MVNPDAFDAYLDVNDSIMVDGTLNYAFETDITPILAMACTDWADPFISNNKKITK